VIKAVVFDFDGVLADSEPLHFRAFRDVLRGVGLVLTEEAYYARYLGYDDVRAFQAIAQDSGITLTEAEVGHLVAQKAVRLEALERGTSVLFPGARNAVIRMAARRPIAIASGARREEIERTLDREGLRSHFPVLVAAEDTAASKPDPAPYRRAVELLALQRTGLRAFECVAVEDSRWGLVSARDAGLRTIAITHSYPAAALTDADAVIDHLDGLTEERLIALTR
jgi:HAD superfamily hydrolase (TIGR01509 family)